MFFTPCSIFSSIFEILDFYPKFNFTEEYHLKSLVIPERTSTHSASYDFTHTVLSRYSAQVQVKRQLHTHA